MYLPTTIKGLQLEIVKVWKKLWKNYTLKEIEILYETEKNRIRENWSRFLTEKRIREKSKLKLKAVLLNLKEQLKNKNSTSNLTLF